MSERERFEAGSGPMLSDEWIEEHWRQAYSQKAFPALTHYTAAVERAVVDQLWSGQAASGSSQGARSDERTGWPPGLLQDDSRELSRALASKPDAMVHARDAVAKIGQPEASAAAAPLGTVWREHELKTDPEVFQAVLDGTKTYEIRLNDRGFAVGDTLRLLETTHTGAEIAAGAALAFTGRKITRHVSHMLTGPIYGLAAGWSILSLAAHPPARSGADPTGRTPAERAVTEEWQRGYNAGYEAGSRDEKLIAMCDASKDRTDATMRAALMKGLSGAQEAGERRQTQPFTPGPPDGTIIVRIGAKRMKSYAVIFKGGEAVEVDVENSRPQTRPFYRLVWRKGDERMGPSAAIAIRAAIAAATGSAHE